MSLVVAGATVDVSPRVATSLGGYAGRTGVSEAIDSPLEINGIRFCTGENSVFLVTYDLLFIPGGFKEKILRAMRAKGHLLEGPELFLAASHTHYAPMVDHLKPKLGSFDSEYEEQLLGRSIELLETLVGSAPNECKIVSGSQQTKAVTSRRLRRLRPSRVIPFLRLRALLLPNTRSREPYEVWSLRVVSDNSLTRAVLWSVPCHPVGSKNEMAISAHYPGEMRQLLRKEFSDEKLPVLFLQGFSGDVRPNLTKWPGWWVFIKNWAYNFANYEGAYKERFEKRLGIDLVMSLRAGLEVANPRVRSRISSISSQSIFEGGSNCPTVELHLVWLSKDICLLGLSLEPFHEYNKLIREQNLGLKVIGVGCVGAVAGYLPTKKELWYGGYEVEGFRKPFGIDGRLLPAAEDALMNLIVSELRKTGGNHND